MQRDGIAALAGFLSTPSARRATSFASRHQQTSLISIHALREEGDGCRPAHLGLLQKFLSTPSARMLAPEYEPYQFLQ